MRSSHLLVTSLLFIGGLTAVDPIQQGPVHDKPWKETFGMTLKGKDRTYVVYQDNSYLLAQPEDLADPAFLHNKDVVIAAKLGRVANGMVTFYNMPKVRSVGPMELWRTRIDGDNLYVFGRFTTSDGVQHFTIVAAETAPSDQQIIDKKIASIKAQLDEAERLRTEAEALKAEYEHKAKVAVADAEAMKTAAAAEARDIVAKAKTKATELIALRGRIAEDRIAAAERNAVADVRAAAAKAATDAAAALLAVKHDAAADKALVDQAIAVVGKA